MFRRGEADGSQMNLIHRRVYPGSIGVVTMLKRAVFVCKDGGIISGVRR